MNQNLYLKTNFGNDVQNHILEPSCSFKFEAEENGDSRDSGISMHFESQLSLKKPNLVEIDEHIIELSDEEVEADRKLRKKTESITKRSRGLCLVDITNRKRTAGDFQTHSENFIRRKSDSFSAYGEEYKNVQIETKILLRRSQSTIETSSAEILLSPAIQQGFEGFSNSLAFREIDGATLVNWMKLPDFWDKYHIVDCRYPYEYYGGHIKGAVNLFEPNKLETLFYPEETEAFMEISEKIPIFYCEYSKTRGPKMANRLRAIDRTRNLNRYPALHYDDIYVLKNGYREFYNIASYQEYCDPKGYVKMRHSDYNDELKRYPFHKSRSTSSDLDGSRKNYRRAKFSRPIQSEGYSYSQPVMSSSYDDEEVFDDSLEFGTSLSQPTMKLESLPLPKFS